MDNLWPKWKTTTNGELQSKVEALKSLVDFKRSGTCLLSHSEKLCDEILALSKQIRECPITLTCISHERERGGDAN